MRTIRTKVYSFSELSNTAQDKAISQFSDINVDYEWWESVYDDLFELCKTIGIEVDLKQTYFSGFSHQGSGSAFTAHIYVAECLKAIKAEKWKEYAPVDKLEFYPVTDNMLRLCHLCSCNIQTANRESSVKINFDADTCGNHPNIDAVITEIEDFFEDVAQTINNWFYRNLEKEYEYLTGSEAIKETIIANDYEFTIDGNRFK